MVVERSRAAGSRFVRCALAALALMLVAAAPASAVPTLWTTDVSGVPKTDFMPNETVYVHGSGFTVDGDYDIPVIRPDGSIVPGDGSFSCPGGATECWDTVPVVGGNLYYEYILDGIAGLYTVEVYDSPWGGPGSGDPLVATVQFTDMAPPQFEAFHNLLAMNQWSGATIQQTNSSYAECDSIPFRIRQTVPAGVPITVILKYDFSDCTDTMFFFDSIRSVDDSEAGLDPFAGLGCVSSGTVSIPIDGSLPGGAQVPGNLSLCNIVPGSVSFGAYVLGPCSGGKKVRSIAVTFTPTGNVGDPDVDIALAYSLHLAAESIYGTGNGANDFAGASPQAAINFDGASSDQNVSINPNAISAEPEACCFTDGTCQLLPPDDCNPAGGQPQGNGTSCDPNICPQPNGACCLCDLCLDGVSEADCMAMAGFVSWTPGTACADVSCEPLPACNIGGPTLVCPGAADLAYSITNPVAGATYDWVISGDGLFDDGTAMASGTSVVVDANVACNTSFTLDVTCTLGNCTSMCNLVVTVDDAVPPVITMSPMDSTVECDGTGNAADLAAFLAQTVTATDNCGTPTITVGTCTLSDDCGATGSCTVTWTATDACGNTAEAMATFTIEDTANPTFDGLPMDATVECDGSGNAADLAAFLAQAITASDTCGTATVAVGTCTLSDDCGATGSCTVTWTATDACGNTAEAMATFTIEDTADPTFDAPPMDSTVECDGAGNAADLAAFLAQTVTAVDDCGTATVAVGTCTLSDDCGSTGSCTVTWTATDACGNTAEAMATFTIEDTADPTFDAPPMDSTVECAGAGNAADLAAFLAQTVTAVDDCGTATVAVGTCTLSDDCGSTGSCTVTWTATDACGNTAEAMATFTIEDTADPTFDAPPMDSTVECDGAGNAADLAAFLAQTVTAVDDCGTATVAVGTCTLSDDCGSTGSCTVTWTATDACGNTAEAMATFTIEDTADPTFDALPMDATVECDGAGNAADLAAFLAQAITASDTCGTATVAVGTCTLSDDCGATGSCTVTWTATDACGNTAEAMATFTIEDTADPTFDALPMDATVECDGAGNAADLAAFLGQTVTAIDDCGTATVAVGTCTLSDDCGATGSCTVTWTATDACGNTAETMATFTIEDTADPTFDAPPMDSTVECDGSGNAADLAAFLAQTVTAVDDCGTATVAVGTCTLSDDCGATGSCTVTWTATDACGNTAEAMATFTIEDTADPTFDAPPMDSTVECDGAGNAADLAAFLAQTVTAVDDCGTATVAVGTCTLSDDCGATGSCTVTWTATDACGNTAVAMATFTIEDTAGPMITCPADVSVQCEADVPADDTGQVTASDACGQVTIVHVGDTPLTDPCGGTITRTYRATDECGNSTDCTQIITVDDTIPPAITCPPDLILPCGDPVPPADVNDVTATDNCTMPANLVITHEGDVMVGAGCDLVIMRTYRATDECGNTAECVQVFKFEREHPGWNWVDNLIPLTGNEPTYWSALTGMPKGLSPFTILDPGALPGRPAMDGTGDRVLRGYVLAWAVDNSGDEIRWNHLKGEGTIVNYRDERAWEYNAFNHAVVAGVLNGEATGTPGALNLDGVEYSPSFDELLLNFQAVGSPAFSGPMGSGLVVSSNTDVTLHPVSADLRQNNDGPVTTKASFDIWNENEVKFSGTHRCITCWDQQLLSRYDAPNHFPLPFLQTNHGKARIDGLAADFCDVLDDPDTPEDESVTSIDTPLLGVSARFLMINGAPAAASGTNMIGMGFDDTALIQYDSGGGAPPEAQMPHDPVDVLDWLTDLAGFGVDSPDDGHDDRSTPDDPPPAQGPTTQDRVSGTEKGSLVIFPKVEIRWDAQGTLIQDTFLSLTNDYPEQVWVQLYFINGDPPR